MDDRTAAREHRDEVDLDIITCLRWSLPAAAVIWAVALWLVLRG